MRDKIVIGRIDKVNFPELFLEAIDVKIDTGAYTSSMHTHYIEEIEINNVPHIRFKLLDPTNPQYSNKEFIVQNYKKVVVKSSFGNVQQRFMIKTKINMFEQTFKINLTLTDRSQMKYPVLLGRKFLSKKFIVDPAQKYLSFKNK